MQRRRSARLAGAPLATAAGTAATTAATASKQRKGKDKEPLVTPWDLVLLGVMALYLFLCPYNKVEESFNTQATHDLLFLSSTTELSQFDHLAFPGVVPRTFWGPLLVAGPARLLAPLLDLTESKLPAQLLVRAILGLYLWAAFVVFRRAAGRKFGADMGVILPLITAAQFHLPFYMTRTLPNVFALGLILLAYARLLLDDAATSLGLLALSTAIFRCDTLVLAVPFMLTMLLRNQLSLAKMVVVGTLSGLVGIGLSVLVDSYFWRRWLWPEGVVLFFNTVENRSSEWGVSPFHWYFTSALPRALLGSTFLIPFGLLLPSGKAPNAMRGKGARSLLWQADPEPFRLLFLPVLGYLALYSLLAHKELRFIFPALPVLNLLAALGLVKLYRRRARRPVPFLLGGACVLASLCAVPLFVAASRNNYPGGVALQAFHDHVSASAAADGAPIRLHIGVAAAETGVSRFGERSSSSPQLPHILYSKAEGLPLAARARGFDYLIAEPEEAAEAAAVHGCEQVVVVDGNPALRLREWLGAVRKGPAGVKAFVGGLREGGGTWEEWVVATRPTLVLLRCAGKGKGEREKEKEGVDDWMTDE